MINVVYDIPLIEEVFKYDVVLFVMGINNSMSSGFNYDIALNFPNVLESEGRYQYGDLRKFGTIHETECDGILFIACYAKKSTSKKNKSDLFIDYEYLNKCIAEVKKFYLDKKIGCKILGCDEYDGNGDEKTVLKIFENHFNSCGNITLYNYTQVNYSDEIYKKIKHAHYKYKHKLIPTDKYLEIRRVLEWRKRYGIFSEVPKDFVYLPKKKMKRKIIHNRNGVFFSEN